MAVSKKQGICEYTLTGKVISVSSVWRCLTLNFDLGHRSVYLKFNRNYYHEKCKKVLLIVSKKRSNVKVSAESGNATIMHLIHVSKTIFVRNHIYICNNHTHSESDQTKTYLASTTGSFTPLWLWNKVMSSNWYKSVKLNLQYKI